MRRFLRWLLGVHDVALWSGAMQELRRDLDDMRDDVEHLGRRFAKLQGQVTRAWRDELPPELPEEELDEFEQLLDEKRRARG